MSDELYVSTSGAVSRMTQLEILANNLANAETVGFKADHVVFETALESALRGQKGRPTPGAPGRSFVRTRQIATDFRSGGFDATGGPLDVAIEGPGFFAVETPSGVRYTRAGNFKVTPDGLLASMDGHPVLGDGGPISVGSRPVHIMRSGEVVDDRENILGRLRVERFDDPNLLVKEGGNLFRAPPLAVGLPVDEPSLREGSLERSNVQPVHEVAVLMMLQRAFEANLQAIRSDDRTLERLIQEVSQ